MARIDMLERGTTADPLSSSLSLWTILFPFFLIYTKPFYLFLFYIDLRSTSHFREFEKALIVVYNYI